MKLFCILLITSLFVFVSCSTSKNKSTEESVPAEITDIGSEGESLGDDVASNLFADENSTKEQPIAEGTDMITPSPMNNVEMSNEESTYKVEKNETLMIVAFKIYGDYSKWRDLANWNRETLNGKTVLSTGMNLKYMAPKEKFEWQPSGNPYLIKTGDTLGRISNVSYGTEKHWKDIWNNNKPLIKDPNIIFAGFTLYTPILEGRDVAFSK